jgi:hypothetical protein
MGIAGANCLRQITDNTPELGDNEKELEPLEIRFASRSWVTFLTLSARGSALPKSGVTAILTAMTDAERPWVMTSLRSILDLNRSGNTGGSGG